MWGYRMYQFTWNIALDENLKPEDIVVNEIDENGYPWENPMIKLKLKVTVRRIFAHAIRTELLSLSAIIRRLIRK